MTTTQDPQNLIVCGIGGQGNILLSRMIGRILTGKGYRVNIGETFGAAQRGGSVYSSMRVSKTRDFGPLVPEGSAHLILSLEPLETLRMLQLYGNPDVLTVTNVQPIYPVGVLSKRVKYPEPGQPGSGHKRAVRQHVGLERHTDRHGPGGPHCGQHRPAWRPGRQ